jgi:aminoglycoside phosphotransferase (APT) family kinase protein
VTGDGAAVRAAAQFHLPGPPSVTGVLPGGLIHRSWIVEAGGVRFVLQRLNRAVFKDLDAVMANIAIVTRHLARKLADDPAGQAERRTLTLVATKTERDWWEDDEGGAWRCTLYVEGSVSRLTAETTEDAFEAGRAFGEFAHLVSDLRTPLAVTIPGFHDTPARLRALKDAVDADRAKRRGGVERELELIGKHSALGQILPSMLASRMIPPRTAHNDAKIANVLFDGASGRALGVLDLDTVMPGTALHDLGDLIRSTVGSAAEDEPEPARMKARPEMFQALVRGYCYGAGPGFTPAERALVVTAGRVITLEQGVRFLTDHLAGDVYYPIGRPGHNLDRARAQLALFADLTARAEQLEEIVATL